MENKFLKIGNEYINVSTITKVKHIQEIKDSREEHLLVYHTFDGKSEYYDLTEWDEIRNVANFLGIKLS